MSIRVPTFASWRSLATIVPTNARRRRPARRRAKTASRLMPVLAILLMLASGIQYSPVGAAAANTSDLLQPNQFIRLQGEDGRFLSYEVDERSNKYTTFVPPRATPTSSETWKAHWYVSDQGEELDYGEALSLWFIPPGETEYRLRLPPIVVKPDGTTGGPVRINDRVMLMVQCGDFSWGKNCALRPGPDGRVRYLAWMPHEPYTWTIRSVDHVPHKLDTVCVESEAGEEQSVEDPVRNYQMVSIKSDFGYFLSVQDDGHLVANREQALSWERLKVFDRGLGQGTPIHYCQPVLLDRSKDGEGWLTAQGSWMFVNPENPHDRSEVSRSATFAIVDAQSHRVLVADGNGHVRDGLPMEGAYRWSFGHGSRDPSSYLHANDYAFSLMADTGQFLDLGIQDGDGVPRAQLGGYDGGHVWSAQGSRGAALSTNHVFDLRLDEDDTDGALPRMRLVSVDDPTEVRALRHGLDVVLKWEGDTTAYYNPLKYNAKVADLKDALHLTISHPDWTSDPSDYLMDDTDFYLATPFGTFLQFAPYTGNRLSHYSGAGRVPGEWERFQVADGLGVARYHQPVGLVAHTRPSGSFDPVGDRWIFINADDPDRRGPVEYGDNVLLKNGDYGKEADFRYIWLGTPMYDVELSPDHGTPFRVQRPGEGPLPFPKIERNHDEFALESSHGTFLTVTSSDPSAGTFTVDAGAYFAGDKETFRAQGHAALDGYLTLSGTGDPAHRFKLVSGDGTQYPADTTLDLVPLDTSKVGDALQPFDTFRIQRADNGQFLRANEHGFVTWVTGAESDGTTWRLRGVGLSGSTAISNGEKVTLLAQGGLRMLDAGEGKQPSRAYEMGDVRLVAEDSGDSGAFTLEAVAEEKSTLRLRDEVRIKGHDGRYVGRGHGDEATRWIVGDAVDPTREGPVEPDGMVAFYAPGNEDEVLIADPETNTVRAADRHSEEAKGRTGFILQRAGARTAVIEPLPEDVFFLGPEDGCEGEDGAPRCAFVSDLVDLQAQQWHPLNRSAIASDPTGRTARFSEGHEIVVLGHQQSYVMNGKDTNYRGSSIDLSGRTGGRWDAAVSADLAGDGRSGIVQARAEADGIRVTAWNPAWGGWQEVTSGTLTNKFNPHESVQVKDMVAFQRPGHKGQEVAVLFIRQSMDFIPVGGGVLTFEWTAQDGLRETGFLDLGGDFTDATLGVGPDPWSGKTNDHLHVGGLRPIWSEEYERHSEYAILSTYEPLEAGGFGDADVQFLDVPAIRERAQVEGDFDVHQLEAAPKVYSLARNSHQPPALLLHTRARWYVEDVEAYESSSTMLVVSHDGAGNTLVEGLPPNECAYSRPSGAPVPLLVGDVNGDFVEEILCWTVEEGSAEPNCTENSRRLEMLNARGEVLQQDTEICLGSEGDASLLDLNRNGRKELAVLSQLSIGPMLEVYDFEDGWSLQAFTALPPWWTGGDPTSLHIVPADVDNDAVIVRWLSGEEGHIRVMGSPTPMMLFAAPPHIKGIGHGAGTVSFDQTVNRCNAIQDIRVSSSYLVGGVDASAGDFIGRSAMVGEQKSSTSLTSEGRCLEATYGRTVGNGEDAIMFAQVPYDVYKYEIVSGAPPGERLLEGASSRLGIAVAGSPRADVWPISHYRRAIDQARADPDLQEALPDTLSLAYMDLPPTVFTHTPGDPGSYKKYSQAKSLHDAIKNNQPGMQDLVTSSSQIPMRMGEPVSVERYVEPQKENLVFLSEPPMDATLGATTRIALGETHETGDSFEWIKEEAGHESFKMLVGGYEHGWTMGGGQSYAVSREEGRVFTATVNPIPEGYHDGSAQGANGKPQTFKWGMLVYPRTLELQGANGETIVTHHVSVVDYYVEDYAGLPPAPVTDAPSPHKPAAGSRTGTRVVFDWAAPAHGMHYQIEVRETQDSLAPWSRSMFVRGTGDQAAPSHVELTIPRDEVNQVLAWRVRAFNDVGIPGPWSEWLRFAPVTEPDRVQDLRFVTWQRGYDENGQVAQTGRVLLEWDHAQGFGPDNIGQAFQYHVVVAGKNGNEVYRDTLPRNRLSLPLPAGSYMIKVAGENIQGIGRYSDPLLFHAPEVPPALEPRATLRHDSLGPACDASREDGACLGLPIVWDGVPDPQRYEYRVTYGEDQVYGPVALPLEPRRIESLNFVAPEGKMTIGVRAIGVWGASPWRSVTFHYSPPPMGPVEIEAVESDVGTEVAWEGAPGAQWYEVQASHSSQFTGAPHEYVVTDTSFHPFDLVQGQYFVRVRPASTGGASNWSNVVKVGVTERLDLRVRDLATNEHGGFPVTWEPSDEKGVNYEVLVYADGFNPENVVTRAVTDEPSYFPEGLSAPEVYHVKVRAATADGVGAWSSPVEASLFEAPGPVTGVQGAETKHTVKLSVDGGDRELTVRLVKLPLTWDPTHVRNYEASGYEVAFSALDASKNADRIVGGSAVGEPVLVVTVNETARLDAGEFKLAAGEYYVQVRADNHGTMGPWSDPVAILVESETNQATPGITLLGTLVVLVVGAALRVRPRRP